MPNIIITSLTLLFIRLPYFENIKTMGNIAEVSMTKLNLNRYFPGMTLIFQSNIIQIKQNALGIQGFIFHWGGHTFHPPKNTAKKKEWI